MTTQFAVSKHPRGRNGRFIEVPDRMQAMGGTWDDADQSWVVPADKAGELRKLIGELGFDPGSRVAPAPAPAAPTPKVGDRLAFAGGTDVKTGAAVPEFKGTVARVSPDGRLMVNAGTKTRPKWIIARAADASAVQRKAPATRGESRRNYAKQLTPDEKAAIAAYQGESYKAINGTLRKGAEPGTVTAKRIVSLDSAISKGVLEKDTTLYRAGSLGGANPADLVGQRFTDHGFVSTSEATTLPLRMASSGSGIFARIKAPAGTPIGYLSKESDRQSTSKYGGVKEQEALLARGSTFDVTGARQDKDGMWIVDMELMPA
jgi:hypothetical protein